MNQEYERLQKLIKTAESEAAARGEGRFRNGYHIMPPTGWLNDPNGLCEYNDEFHLFFQYSPLDARGGMKAWGHYVTKDFVNLRYEGAPFVPDEDYDRNGVYSGSTYVDERGMHIFYTGNVKLAGDYDYINAGRRADTVLVESINGHDFSGKRVVIDTDEYPQGYSCHIRDPKVWKENGTYYMVLGARTKDSVGQILIYSSSDMIKWSLYRIIASEKIFGYMWECPDIFRLDDDYVISFSPQGLEAEEYRYQNTYQSGYVIRNINPLTERTDGEARMDIAGDIDVIRNDNAQMEGLVIDQEDFVEWDMGFDFYAPQTFKDNSGRRILVGWAGMPDPGYENGEVETENWQHCFTVPRCLEVKEGTDGRRRVFQTPVKELEALRTGEMSTVDMDVSEDDDEAVRLYSCENECLDILCNNISGGFSVALAVEAKDITVSEKEPAIRYTEGVTFSYDGSELSLTLSDGCGLGRKIRKAKLSEIHSLRILVDTSIVEFYVNDGEMVFTTRYYKNKAGASLSFDMPGAEVAIYNMDRIKVNV